jgi:hypothetical protein
MDFATVPPVTDLAFVPQKIWENIDVADLPTAARIFRKVFPKKSRKILADSSITPITTHPPQNRELLRRIALDPHTTPAGAYSLGTAVSQLSNSPNAIGGDSRG